VFYDDKASTWAIDIASTEPKDKQLEEELAGVLGTMYGDLNLLCQVEIVGGGNIGSEHYHLMEHLSVQAGVAVDRSKELKQYLATSATIGSPR
jgi:hypothetical protein